MTKKKRIESLEDRIEMLVARISYLEYMMNARIPKEEYIIKGNQLISTIVKETGVK